MSSYDSLRHFPCDVCQLFSIPFLLSIDIQSLHVSHFDIKRHLIVTAFDGRWLVFGNRQFCPSKDRFSRVLHTIMGYVMLLEVEQTSQI